MSYSSSSKSGALQRAAEKYLLPVVICCLMSNIARAEWVLSPSASIGSGYSSNLLLLSSDLPEENSLSNSISTSLQITKQTDRVTAAGSATLSYTNYSGEVDIDNTDRQYLNFQIQRDFNRGSLGVSTSFYRDDLLRFNSVLSDPDSPLTDVGDDLAQDNTDPDGNLNFTSQQIARTTRALKTLSQYSLTERNKIRLNYNYVDRRFDDVQVETISGTLTTAGSKQHVLNLDFSREMNERSRVSWRIRASRNDNPTTDSMYSYESTLGWSSRLSDQTTVQTRLGVTRTSGSDNNKTGLALDASINHRVNWGSVTAQASRNFRPNLLGDMTQIDTLRLRVVRNLTPNWDLTLEAFGNRQNFSFGDFERDLNNYRVSPGLQWHIAPSWRLSAAYVYQRLERNITLIENTGTNHSTSISIIYDPAGKKL